MPILILKSESGTAGCSYVQLKMIRKHFSDAKILC